MLYLLRRHAARERCLQRRACFRRFRLNGWFGCCLLWGDQIWSNCGSCQAGANQRNGFQKPPSVSNVRFEASHRSLLNRVPIRIPILKTVCSGIPSRSKKFLRLHPPNTNVIEMYEERRCRGERVSPCPVRQYPESAVSGKALRPLESIHLIVFLGIRG